MMWATSEAGQPDVRLALKSAGQPVDADHVCQVLAIVEQESGYDADPAVPGLGRVVQGGSTGCSRSLALQLRWRVQRCSTIARRAGAYLEARLAGIRTEQDADLLYREIVAFHRARYPGLSRAMDLLAPDLVEKTNPITTAGSMQVSVSWAVDEADADDSALLRDSLYTGRWAEYGTARLFAHDAPYDSPRYRFADYNAGVYASRNAALQAQLSVLTGRPLATDGDFLLYDNDGDARRKQSKTVGALMTFRARHAPHLSESRIRRDAAQEKSAAFDDTETVEALRAAYTRETGKAAVYAVVPDVALHSPKMKSGRSTRWFTDNVMIRYNDCLGRSGRK